VEDDGVDYAAFELLVGFLWGERLGGGVPRELPLAARPRAMPILVVK